MARRRPLRNPSPRHPRLQRLAGAPLVFVVAAVVPAGGLTACSGAVDVEPPAPSGPALAACQDLLDSLPKSVADQDRRDIRPSDALAAAWGDPAIVLRCGVVEPAALTPDAQLVEVNGVAWLAQELTAGYRFTTAERAVFVEVDVPDDYAPEGAVLVDLADLVQAALPPTDPTP